MASQVAPTVLRLLAASVNVANKSGSIIRSVLSSGNLGIVEKVGGINHHHHIQFIHSFNYLIKFLI